MRGLLESDLTGRVRVHGPVSKERVAAFYRDADVFVLPSLREPYGTVYGEAMAAGLPVVGWRAGNLPHLATDGREGLLLEPGDVDGLSRALHRLATDDVYRRSWPPPPPAGPSRSRPGRRPPNCSSPSCTRSHEADPTPVAHSGGNTSLKDISTGAGGPVLIRATAASATYIRQATTSSTPTPRRPPP